LDHALDADKQVISQQFRSDVKNPLFVQLGKQLSHLSFLRVFPIANEWTDTDKMIDVTPANIKENVKVGCKCQMALEVKGWTYRLRREDKVKGVGEAVIVRLKLAPIVIGISAPPKPTKPWDFSFSKLESKSKAHQLAEAQSTASTSMEQENDTTPAKQEGESVEKEDVSVEKAEVQSDLSEEDDVDEKKRSYEDDDGKKCFLIAQTNREITSYFLDSEDSEVKKTKSDDQV
jgi:hypothetical protein